MAKLDNLKQEATELGIEFNSKATIAELEGKIAEKKAELEAKATEAEEGAKNEATLTEEPKEETKVEETKAEEPKEEPKKNKDGFIAGKELTPAEYAKFMAKQRLGK